MKKTVYVCLLLPPLITGCTGNNVYVATDTSIGINGALNTAQTSGEINIGYDRKFTAYVPHKQAPDGSEKGDAMTTYNCTKVEIKGTTLSKFYERLATGKAAEDLVRKLKKRDKDNDCSFEEAESKTAGTGGA